MRKILFFYVYSWLGFLFSTELGVLVSNSKKLNQMRTFLLSVCVLFCLQSLAQQPAHQEIYQEFEVSKNAEFPGGVEAFRKMLQENLTYPKEAKEKNVEGKSILSFVIDKDGTIGNVKILKRLGSGCDEAAINAILATKHIKWSPALNTEGKAVKVRKTIPIDFKIPKSEEKK